MPKDFICFIMSDLKFTPNLGGGGLQESAIWRIPWGHHKYIIDKCFNNLEKAITNFKVSPPVPQSNFL